MLVAAFTKRLTNYEQQLWEHEMLPPRSNAFNSVEMVHLVKCLLCWQEITSQSFQWPDSQGEPCNKCLNSWNTEQRDDSAFVHHVRWSIKEESRHLLKSTACPETRCGVKETGRLGGRRADVDQQFAQACNMLIEQCLWEQFDSETLKHPLCPELRWFF